MRHVAAVMVWFALPATINTGQLLPPPRDGDIRAAYWELRNQTEVWLTLEPRNSREEAAPLLTFTHRFEGKWPAGPPVRIEVRAYATVLRAPRAELSFVLDGKHRIHLRSQTGLTSGMPSDYLSESISIETLKQLAAAERIAGDALGFEFELAESQRRALRAFLERVLSDNPAQQPRW